MSQSQGAFRSSGAGPYTPGLIGILITYTAANPIVPLNCRLRSSPSELLGQLSRRTEIIASMGVHVSLIAGCYRLKLNIIYMYLGINSLVFGVLGDLLQSWQDFSSKFARLKIKCAHYNAWKVVARPHSTDVQYIYESCFGKKKHSLIFMTVRVENKFIVLTKTCRFFSLHIIHIHFCSASSACIHEIK